MFAFWVSSIAGVSMNGESISVETGTSSLELMIADTSAISVHRTSWVRLEDSVCVSIESKILCATPIIRSHTSPICEECGGLKVQAQP